MSKTQRKSCLEEVFMCYKTHGDLNLDKIFKTLATRLYRDIKRSSRVLNSEYIVILFVLDSAYLLIALVPNNQFKQGFR